MSDERKIAAFNLMLTSENPTVKRLAERYLDGANNIEEFTRYLREHKPVPLQDAGIDEDCR